MARLNEICELCMGQSPDSASYNENGDGIPFFQGNADFGTVHPNVRIWCSSPTKIAKKGDILISVRAPIGALNIADAECCIGRGLAALTVNESICNRMYLWYGITSKVAELNSKGTGSTFKAISKNVLAETEIPLPSLDAQLKISLILDKLTDLIDKRKQQLSKLDELIKARFVELFDGRYKTRTLGSVCEELFAGGDVKKEISSDVQSEEHPYPIYTNGEKNNGLYGYTSIARVTKEAITISGRGTIGFTCLRKEPFYPAVRLIVAVPNQELVSGCYLQHFIRSKNYGGQGASIPQLTVPMVKDELIPVPPLELQNQFATFIEQTDKSKLEVQKSLEKLELLKKALMQKYFG